MLSYKVIFNQFSSYLEIHQSGVFEIWARTVLFLQNKNQSIPIILGSLSYSQNCKIGLGDFMKDCTEYILNQM